MARFLVDGHVAFPQVSVDEAGLDLPTFSLEGSEQKGDHLAGHLFGGAFQLGPRAVGLYVELADVEEQLPEEDGPVLLPFDRVSRLAIARRNVKAKLARGRLADLVHLCQPAGELRRVRGGGHVHVDKLGEIEIQGRLLHLVSPESKRLGDEIRHEPVYLFGRLEFPVQHDALVVAIRNLPYTPGLVSVPAFMFGQRGGVADL